MMRQFASLVLVALAGCASAQQSGAVIERAPRDWRLVATADDRDRLRDWRDAFVEGLREARADGRDAAISREGKLLEPDAALGGGPIPNGTYRCRTIKLGSKSGGMLPFVAYPAFTCRIRAERDVQGFAKLTGSQRQVGLIFPGDALRQVFLGTLLLGDEARSMQYGRDRERDVAGFLERIGPGRWRLIMPRPHFESDIDILELVPAA